MGMKKLPLTIAVCLSIFGLILNSLQSPAWSQSSVGIEGIELIRAKNLARRVIENLNGGIEAYRAEPSMHGSACQAPYVTNEDGSWTFTFKGSFPGSNIYSIESVVTVTRDGSADVQYNGPVRSRAETDSIAPDTPSDEVLISQCTDHIVLLRAKNLARKAAETANGGLSRYRAEPSMHGLTRDAPYVDNGNGSWTFTFQGGAPGSEVYTIESVVTVTDEGVVTVEYNGPVR